MTQIFSALFMWFLLKRQSIGPKEFVSKSFPLELLRFVTGVGAMSYSNFSFYNVAGALLWTSLFVGGGALLGNVPAVKHNFSIVSLCSIFISLLA